MDYGERMALLRDAELLFDAETCRRAVRRMAEEITAAMGDLLPLVLPVMGGAVVFTGQLLPLLRFPLDFDYVHVSRYGDRLKGGNFDWKRMPQQDIRGRHVLILDDILDEGLTMAAIRAKILESGAASCRSAVFADKILNREKPVSADFVGLRVPDRYVFGYGMDVSGAWRNLPEIYALNRGT